MRTTRIISKDKSHWPLDEASVRSWLVDRGETIRQALSRRFPDKRVLLEHARVVGRRETPAGSWLVDPSERTMFVVNVPVVGIDQPWATRKGLVVVDGRRRFVEESEGTWRRREERVEGKRMIHTQVQSNSTVREREPRPLEPIPWDDAAEPAPTLTLWVDQYGRVYDPME